MKTYRLFVPALVLLVFLSQFLSAATPKRWTVSTLEGFLAGDLKGVSATSDGRLLPAPSFASIFDTREAFVYSSVVNKAGDLLVGTGSNGKIFRVSPDGSGSELATLTEPGVYALAVDSTNRLYAATSPDGKVYRLSGQGEPQAFFDPEEKYIWALAIDSQDNLFVGTGPDGIIYKVTPQGEESIFYDSEETHVVALEWDLEGNLLAGTDPGALLLRLSPAGRPYVLYDSRLAEMKAIAVDRYGRIYGAALSSSPSPPPAAQSPPEAASSEKEAGPSNSTLSIARPAQGGRLEIYSVDRDGVVDLLYGSADQLAYDLLMRGDGNLLVATGDRGRILSIDAQRFATLLVDSEEEQITSLRESNGEVLATASNLGKIYKLSRQAAGAGSYESEVLDAGVIAAWGTVAWNVHNPTGSGVQLFTRSGNTERPDATWNDWRGPYTSFQGSPIQSLPARYLQWKIQFPAPASEALLSQDNAVDMVSISYQQRNVAPLVTSVTVHAPGLAFASMPPPNTAGGVTPGGPDGAHAGILPREIRELETPRMQPPPRKVYIPGARSLSWNAHDANGDELVYSLHYRRQEESEWRLLEEGLSDNQYTLDGSSFADGTYVVRITASDLPDNPPEAALESRLAGKPFVIANSLPVIELSEPRVQGQSLTLGFTITSRSSPLFQAQYALDDGDWATLYPEDGIADGTRESFRLTLERIPSGSHTLRIRAADLNGNLSTAQTGFSN